MMLKVGKLYSCSKYFLMLYPDKKTAAAAPRTRRSCPAAAATAQAAAHAAYWNKRFGKPVSYCNPLTPLLILSADKEYVEVLAEDKRGWIINEDWLKLKEIHDEAA